MPNFLASSVDSMISSTVIFLSMFFRMAADPDSTPRLSRSQPAKRISRSSGSVRRSTRGSQLQKNESFLSRMPRQSSTTRLRLVVNVSSLIWIILTGRRAVAFPSASSTYSTDCPRNPRPQVVSAPQNVRIEVVVRRRQRVEIVDRRAVGAHFDAAVLPPGETGDAARRVPFLDTRHELEKRVLALADSHGV